MIQGDSALDQDAKELLRQKSLGIDMSDPRTRLRIELALQGGVALLHTAIVTTQ
jgi:hypothetical protein